MRVNIGGSAAMFVVLRVSGELSMSDARNGEQMPSQDMSTEKQGGFGAGADKVVKKLFGGINLTWPKLIIAAIIAGVFTAAMAIFPIFQNSSFTAITVTMEAWILIGILIAMNSKSNLDSALKCFVFFLISQPLIYLLQVPFSWMGWGLFSYYKYWFIWTVLCFPMGYIAYWMKKDKWWGYLILLPVLVLTAYSFLTYFADFQFSAPRYILVTLFCACALIFYPVAIFNNPKIRLTGAVLGCVAVIGLTAYCLINPPVYSTEIMTNNEEHQFDDSCTAYLADEKYGDVEIIYIDSIEDYALHADFKKAGDTVLTMVSAAGEKTEYDLHIERDKSLVTKR